MSEPITVIMYRSPWEQSFWESDLLFPLLVWMFLFLFFSMALEFPSRWLQRKVFYCRYGCHTIPIQLGLSALMAYGLVAILL